MQFIISQIPGVGVKSKYQNTSFQSNKTYLYPNPSTCCTVVHRVPGTIISEASAARYYTVEHFESSRGVFRLLCLIMLWYMVCTYCTAVCCYYSFWPWNAFSFRYISTRTCGKVIGTEHRWPCWVFTWSVLRVGRTFLSEENSNITSKCVITAMIAQRQRRYHE